MKQTFSITRKELDAYFSSPMALIFVGVFLAVTLFTFFWIDGFWARGTADVRSLFRWMPLLMIFLVATLTMRQWSEEQQTGTLEVLLTMPIRIPQLVLGKFLAVLVMVAVALLLTLFLPITIATLGSLDWGPVVGGYLAAVLMASAYIAVGLFVSSRTDNQIVALILTVLVCGVLHLIGSPTLTDFIGSSRISEILRTLSTSSRFQSIERGVIDLRDLLYYLTVAFIFLTLNVLSLDMRRWSQGAQTRLYRQNVSMGVTLLVLNALLFNVLLSPVSAARVDLTADQEYSLSPVTKDLLKNLREPLLIRGYFSDQNHPLLEPLIPRLRDMLAEYEVASGGKLTVEILDPVNNPELEAEANQTYGIRPIPLQTADRSGSSILNVYFDILIRYGDQTETLNFQDLITIDQFGSSAVEVRLRNLEYDLTSSIKRVVFGFQSIDSVLASLESPARLTLFVTPATLPEVFADVPQTVESVAQAIQEQSGGKFTYEVVDMSQGGVNQEQLAAQYQIFPIATSFFSPDSYYLHMVVQAGTEAQVIYPSGALSETEIRTSIEAALKRAAPGFLQVVGLWTPPNIPQVDAFGQQVPSLQQFQIISQILGENYEVRPLSLTDGQVPTEIDVLVVIAPQNMSDLERYAIDQYLMRGGSVLVATGSYQLAVDQFSQSFSLQPVGGGLDEMLASYGVMIEPTIVMDIQNAPFPAQITRDAGGFMVTEIQAVDYPFFVDVRQDGMERDSAIVSGLSAVTLNFVSPIGIADNLQDFNVTSLLKSTESAWTTTTTNIQPNPDLYPQYGFPVEGEQRQHVLAVAVEGSFGSFFKDKEIPSDPTTPEGETEAVNPLQAVGIIEQSPSNARLVVFGSSEFLNDNIINLAQSFSGDRAANNLQLLQNTVEWFVEDVELASIRSRGASVRLLDPLSAEEQTQWEVINYALALVALLALAGVWRISKRAEKPMDLVPMDELIGKGA